MEENTGENLCDPDLGRNILEIHKTHKDICSFKVTLRKMKRQSPSRAKEGKADRPTDI